MSNATMFWLHLNAWSTRRIPGVFDIDDSFAAFGEAIAASRQTPLDSDGGIDALDQPSKLPRSGKG